MFIQSILFSKHYKIKNLFHHAGLISSAYERQQTMKKRRGNQQSDKYFIFDFDYNLQTTDHNQMPDLKPLKTLLLITLATLASSYIDLTLSASVSSSDIIYNFPLTVDSQKYIVGISLENRQQFLVAPQVVKHKHKPSKQTHSKKDHEAHMHVFSLQGSSLEGWKRFFLQVFTLVDSKYSHQIHFNVSGLKFIDKYLPLTNGLMTLGPQINENKIFGLIKNQTNDYFREDVFSLYTTPGGKEIRLQLGGYQQQNARGYKNGVRFYEKDIGVSKDNKRWMLPVKKLVIAKEKGRKWDLFTIPESTMDLTLSVESQFVILPIKHKEDLETSFETQNIQCSFASASLQLECANISSIDEALTFISFYLDQSISVNISLYDLRAQYNSETKVTSFYVKLSHSEDELQIGSSLLRGYYISINMVKKSMLFSPINRFTPEISTVSLLRFIILFILFMFGACVCIAIWQQFNNPDYKRRLTRSKDGVKLVPYQKANDMEDDF